MYHLSRLLKKNLIKRAMLFICVIALLSLGLGGARGVAHATSTQANPAGKWNLQVFFQNCSFQGEIEPSQILINVSGAVVSQTPYQGGGLWEATGLLTFDYGFTEMIYANGQFVAFVVVFQQAQLTSSTTFTASGLGVSYDAQGNYQQTCNTQTSGTLG